ncbi:MAG: hypothetical protein JWO69_165 [Thermoleophilia bacterium]|jgi:signal transduction histidine kinase|nr:hypothetical protein [Thermoleophilia bacterium]
MDWLAQHTVAVSIIDAILEFAVAVALLVGVRVRVGRVGILTWLVAGYFLVESVVSVNRAVTGGAADATGLGRELALELAGTLLMVAMLSRASHVGRVLRHVVDGARARAAEYERARRHYTVVVRHRIANPLTVIKGAAQTLEREQLPDDVRHELRLAIIAAAEQLEAISLGPAPAGTEEHELDAVPDVAN